MAQVVRIGGAAAVLGFAVMAAAGCLPAAQDGLTSGSGEAEQQPAKGKVLQDAFEQTLGYKFAKCPKEVPLRDGERCVDADRDEREMNDLIAIEIMTDSEDRVTYASVTTSVQAPDLDRVSDAQTILFKGLLPKDWKKLAPEVPVEDAPPTNWWKCLEDGRAVQYVVSDDGLVHLSIGDALPASPVAAECKDLSQ